MEVIVHEQLTVNIFATNIQLMQHTLVTTSYTVYKKYVDLLILVARTSMYYSHKKSFLNENKRM